MKNLSKQKKKHKQFLSWKKTAAMVSSLVMMISAVPANAMQSLAAEARERAEASKMNFPQDLIDAMQEICGNEYDAEEVLKELYKHGIIDGDGNYISTGLYNIDGVYVTEDEMRAMAMQHSSEDEVLAEGELITWGELGRILLYKDYLLALQEYREGCENGSIDPDDKESLALQKDLLNELQHRITLGDNGQLFIADNNDDEEDYYYPFDSMADDSLAGYDSTGDFSASDLDTPVMHFYYHDATYHDDFDIAKVPNSERGYVDYKISKTDDSVSTGEYEIQIAHYSGQSGERYINWELKSIDTPFDDTFGSVIEPIEGSGIEVRYSDDEEGRQHRKGTFIIDGSASVSGSEKAFKVKLKTTVSNDVNSLQSYKCMLSMYAQNFWFTPSYYNRTFFRESEMDAYESWREGRSRYSNIYVSGEKDNTDYNAEYSQYKDTYAYFTDALNQTPGVDPKELLASYIKSVEVVDGYYGSTDCIPVIVRMADGKSLRYSGEMAAKDDKISLRYTYVDKDGVKHENQTAHTVSQSSLSFESYLYYDSVTHRDTSVKKVNEVNGDALFDIDENGNEYLVFLIPVKDYQAIYLDGMNIPNGDSLCDAPFKQDVQFNSVYNSYNYSEKGSDGKSYEKILYQKRNIAASVSERAKGAAIFDTANATIEKVTGSCYGSEVIDNRRYMVKVPFAKKTSDDIEREKKLEGAEGQCPYTNESQQWLLEQTDNYTSPYLKGCYMETDSSKKLQDTKIYYHHYQSEDGTKDYYDYLYFYVIGSNNTNNVDLAVDVLRNPTDKDYSTGNWSLPSLNLPFYFYGEAFNPYVLDYDQKREWGYEYDNILKYKGATDEGAYVVIKPEYETQLSEYKSDKSDSLWKNSWIGKHMYMIINRIYGYLINQDCTYIGTEADGTDYGEVITKEPYADFGHQETQQSVWPRSATVDFSHPYFEYSKTWTDGMDSMGATNGVPLQYWRNSTLDYWSDENRAARRTTDSDGEYSLKNDINNHTYYWQGYFFNYEEGHDPDSPVNLGYTLGPNDGYLDTRYYDTCDGQKHQINTGAEAYITSYSAYAKLVNQYQQEHSGEYPLSLTYVHPDVTYNEEVPYSPPVKYVRQIYGKDSSPLFYTWTAEFTSNSGETTTIYPGEEGKAVEFTVTLDEEGNRSKVNIVKFNENDEGTIVFKLKMANSQAAAAISSVPDEAQRNKLQKELEAEDNLDYVVFTSSPIELQTTTEPYLIVPSASKKITAYQDSTANILFSSNIARRNKTYFNSDKTSFKIQVFECDGDGNITNNTAVYTAFGDATYNESLTNFTIPEEVLSNLSEDGKPAYKAVISASLDETVEGLKDFSDTALIIVNEKPLSFIVDTDSSFFINNKDAVIGYNVINAEDTFDGYYTITRKSDNKFIAGGLVPSTVSNGQLHTIVIPKEDLEIKSDSLKDNFSLTFYGRNDSSESYSIGSTLLNVYNDGSLQINIAGKAIPNGSEYLISNKELVKSMISKDDEHIIDRNGKPLSNLQSLVALTKSLKINKGGQLGVSNDIINWTYKKDSEHESGLYYILFNVANEIAEEGKILIPNTDLKITGEDKASGTIEAEHVKTGMKADVNVKFEDVKGQLYLMQFVPAAKTTVEYVNGDGETVTVESDSKGQLSLYDEKGFKEGSKIIAHSEYKNAKYKNDFNASEMKSGSGDEFKGNYFPINTLKLRVGYTAAITIPEAKNKDVVVRGGVYRYSDRDIYNHLDTYCADADLLKDINALGTEDGKSNGIDGVTYHADANGTFIVYFDSDQIVKKGEDETKIPIGMAFEVEVNGFNKKTFVITDAGSASEYSVMNYATVNLDKKSTDKEVKVFSHQVLYPSSGKCVDITGEMIGYSKTSPTVYFYVDSAFYGYEDKFLAKDTDGYSYIKDDNTANVYYLNMETEDIIESDDDDLQVSKTYAYQFSTMVNNNLTFTCSEDKLSGLMEKGYFVQTALGAFYNGGRIYKEDNEYSILNSDDIDNPVDPSAVKQMKKDIKKQLTGTDNFFTAENGDGWKGKIFSGAIQTIVGYAQKIADIDNMTGQTLNCAFLPTSDPTEFEVLFGIGAEDSMLSDEYIDKNVSVEAKAQFAQFEASTEDDDEDDEDVGFLGYLAEGFGTQGDDVAEKLGKNETSEAFNDHKKLAKDKKENPSTAKNPIGGDKDENGNYKPKAEAKVGVILYGIVKAKYNPDAKDGESKWSFSFKGLTFGVDLEVEIEFLKGNGFVGPVPITYSCIGNISIAVKSGTKSQTIKYDYEIKDGIGKYGQKSVDTVMNMLTLDTKVGAELYCGVGFDYELIALSVGMFVNGELSFNLASLFYGDGKGNIKNETGIEIGGSIEIGLKVKARVLFFTYENNIASVSVEGSVMTSGYRMAKNIWSGNGGSISAPKLYNARTGELQSLSATEYTDGSFDIRLDTISENAPKLLAGVAPDESIFTSSDKANKLTSIRYSDDGQMIIYLDDNVASFADGSGVSQGAVISSSDKNLAAGEGIKIPVDDEDAPVRPELTDEEIAELENDPEQEAYGETIRNFGDYDTDISGKDGHYFAAWSQQRNETAKEKNDNAEVNLADLAIALNSTEIIASVYKDGSWTSEKLTNNYQSDTVPTVASFGDKAVIVWETSYSSDIDNLMQSDVTDMLVYSVYDGENWSEPAVAYDGSFGSIGCFDTEMTADGASMVTFTVQTETGSSDVFYTLIDSENKVQTPVRATLSENSETDVRVASAKDTFVIAWYDTEARDIMLLAVREDGTIDNSFPERVTVNGYVSNTTNIFDIVNGENVEDITIVWAARETVTDEDENVEVRRSVYGSKFYTDAEGNIGIAPAQLISTVDEDNSPDELSAVSDGNNVSIVLKETNYGEVKNKDVAVEAAAQMLLSNESFDTEEEYNKAFEEKVAELKEENNSDYLSFLTADEKSKISRIDYTFKEMLSIENAEYDEKAIVPNIDTIIDLTITNDGITPVDEIILNETTPVALDEPLNPGESVVIPYLYEVPEDVKDIAFSVEANGSKAEATLIVDAPKPLVESIETAKAENGIRTFNVHVVNELNVPFETSDKELSVEVYTDSDCTNLLSSQKITDKDILGQLDSGIGNIEVSVDVKELMTALEIKDKEIPEEGIPVYIMAVLRDDEGSIVEASMKSVLVESKLTDRKNPLGITSVLEKSEDGTTVNVMSEIQNLSLEKQYLCNINIQLFDEDGNVIAEQNTYNGNDYDEFAGETSKTDEKYNVTFTFTSKDEFDKVAYSASSAFNSELTVTFDMGAASDAKNIEKTVNLGSKASAIETPVSEYGVFAGWYADKELDNEFDFESAILKDTTVYAKWQLPNIDAAAEGCFVGADGEALVYDAETRTLTADGEKNPTVNEGSLSVDLSKLSADGLSGEEYFKAVWYDAKGTALEGEPVNSGDYTVKISGTEEGITAGVSGTLTVHVTLAPYVLSVNGVVPENREYDGTNVVKLNCTNAELVPPTENGFFHGDEVELDTTDSVYGEADGIIGNVTVKYAPKLKGANASNYTFGDETTVQAEISRRKAKLAWGTVNENGIFTEGVDELYPDQNGNVSVNAVVTNTVGDDTLTVECENASAKAVFTEITTKAVKLSGKASAFYELGENTECKWQISSDKIVLDSASLTLTGNIGVNIYAYIPDELISDEKACVTISSASSTEKFFLKDLDDKGGRYRFTHEVAAKEMNDDIAVYFQSGTGKIMPMIYKTGNAVSSNTFRYSVADYITTVEDSADGTYTDSLKALVEALRNYGSYTQKYFGYDTDNMLEAAGDVSEVTAETLRDYRFTESGELPEGIELSNATLIVESDTSIRLYFNVLDNHSITEYTFKADDRNVTPVNKGDAYYIELADIPARNLDRMYAFSVSRGDAEYTVNYSALSYAELVLSQYENRAKYADLCNVARALYLYNEAADVFFANAKE